MWGFDMPTRRQFATIVGGSILGLASRADAAPGVFTKDGYAIGGYDPAAYWTDKKAKLGQVGFNCEWKGVNWIFTNPANRDTFLASPEKYAPRMNGYCPFCLAGGKLVPGVGNIYDIHKGRLYLLLSQRIREDFVMKADYYVERAEAYWAKLS